MKEGSNSMNCIGVVLRVFLSVLCMCVCVCGVFCAVLCGWELRLLVRNE